jgi:hypothetical protein
VCKCIRGGWWPETLTLGTQQKGLLGDTLYLPYSRQSPRERVGQRLHRTDPLAVEETVPKPTGIKQELFRGINPGVKVV